MQSWLEGRNWVGKGAQATGMTTSLRILSSKADSNTWESFTRSELKLESVHQEPTCSDIFRKRATKSLLKQKQCQKHLTWAKQKNNWTVAQWFTLPSADKVYGDADFLFQQDFSTCPQCQNHLQAVCWPWYYCAWLASQHAWPEPHMESMGYFQEKDEKQSIQQYRRAEGSIVPQQCHRLIASMPHLTDAGICAKVAPTKYWVQKWTTHFKESFFFWLVLGNILIFWDTGFLTFMSSKL